MTALVDPAPISAILLGFLLGLQHATDPDHLVAVATILTRERRFMDGALIGVLWGAGHMTTQKWTKPVPSRRSVVAAVSHSRRFRRVTSRRRIPP